MGSFCSNCHTKTFGKNKVSIAADKWFASNKTCCNCGLRPKGLGWSERVFACPSCGFKMDHDHNAALNLKNYGLKQLGLERPDTKTVEFKTSTHA